MRCFAESDDQRTGWVSFVFHHHQASQILNAASLNSLLYEWHCSICIYTALHPDVPAVLYRPAKAVPDFFVHELIPRIPTSSRFVGPLAVPVYLAVKI